MFSYILLTFYWRMEIIYFLFIFPLKQLYCYKMDYSGIRIPLLIQGVYLEWSCNICFIYLEMYKEFIRFTSSGLNRTLGQTFPALEPKSNCFIFLHGMSEIICPTILGIRFAIVSKVAVKVPPVQLFLTLGVLLISVS